MKKQLVLVLALATISMTACEEDYAKKFASDPSTAIAIKAIYPESAVCGSAVTSFGENFGASISDSHVTVRGPHAEIMEVEHGIGAVQGSYVNKFMAHIVLKDTRSL